MYKVVAIADNGDYVSSVCYGGWQRRYAIDEWTEDEHGLFVFPELGEARSYLDYLKYERGFSGLRAYAVFAVDVSDTWEPLYICESYEEELLNDYHNGHDESLQIAPPWRLLLAKSVKLVEMVQ